MEFVWKDGHILRSILSLFMPMLFLGSVYVLINSTNTNVIGRTVVMITFILSLLFTITINSTKLTKLNKGGILVGNAKNDKYESINLSKPQFIAWKDVKRIEIIRKEVRHPVGFVLNNFLIVTTKSHKTNICFLANARGFVNAIDQLHKSKLLTKKPKNLTYHF